MHELTGFQRDMLVVLGSIDGANGSQLKRELQRTRYASIHPSRLYHNLDALVRRSLVCKENEGGRSNEYRLTSAGRERVRDHHEWQRRYIEGSTLVQDGLAP